MSSSVPPNVPVKVELRRTARARRSNFVAGLPRDAQHFSFRAVPSPLLDMIGDRKIVSLYLPIGDEAPAARFARHLRRMGFQLCLPRVSVKLRQMNFLLWSDDDPLEGGPLGTRHPFADASEVVPEVMITPMLAFDRALHRLGQGGGYYDRAFADNPDALRIGVAWSVQEMDALPIDPWDMKLDAVITECEVIQGNAR